jgi:hypothetical protein
MRLPSFARLMEKHLILRVSSGSRGVDLKSVLRTLAWSSFLPAAVCLGSTLDGTWELAGDGKGLGEHLGFWAWVVTTPLLVELTVAILACFLATMRNLEEFTTGPVPPQLRRLLGRHLKSISLRSDSRYILYLFSLVGFMFAILNIRETLQPVSTYGNIVYDSLPFLRGFLLTKMYLMMLWTLVYPPVLYVVLHVTISVSMILKELCDRDLLKIDFFHRDNCGGLSVFGFINTLVMAVYATILVVVICLDLTHSRRYSTLLLSLFATSALLLLQSVATVYYIHKCATIQRNKLLISLNKRLSAALIESPGAERPSDLFSLRAHVLALHTFPYAKPVSLAMNILRFSPALVAFGKIFTSGAKFLP